MNGLAKAFVSTCVALTFACAEAPPRQSLRSVDAPSELLDPSKNAPAVEAPRPEDAGLADGSLAAMGFFPVDASSDDSMVQVVVTVSTACRPVDTYVLCRSSVEQTVAANGAVTIPPSALTVETILRHTPTSAERLALTLPTVFAAGAALGRGSGLPSGAVLRPGSEPVRLPTADRRSGGDNSTNPPFLRDGLVWVSCTNSLGQAGQLCGWGGDVAAQFTSVIERLLEAERSSATLREDLARVTLAHERALGQILGLRNELGQCQGDRNAAIANLRSLEGDFSGAAQQIATLLETQTRINNEHAEAMAEMQRRLGEGQRGLDLCEAEVSSLRVSLAFESASLAQCEQDLADATADICTETIEQETRFDEPSTADQQHSHEGKREHRFQP